MYLECIIKTKNFKKQQQQEQQQQQTFVTRIFVSVKNNTKQKQTTHQQQQHLKQISFSLQKTKKNVAF